MKECVGPDICDGAWNDDAGQVGISGEREGPNAGDGKAVRVGIWNYHISTAGKIRDAESIVSIGRKNELSVCYVWRGKKQQN